MMISKAARLAALLVGVSALVAALPATAQRSTRSPETSSQRRAAQQPQQPPAQAGQPAQRRYDISRDEQRALQPLLDASNAALNAQQAGQPANWAGVQALVPAALAAARGNDARYFITKVQFSIARGTNNIAGQEAALTTLAANPSTPADEGNNARAELNRLKNVRAEQAFQANDYVTAERLYAELVRANPSDTRIAGNLAIVRSRMGNTEGALEPILTQITAAEANGGRASQDLYRRARDRFYTDRNGTRAIEFATKLARNYPTRGNWRDVVVMYREFGRPSGELTLVSYRLQRAANALEGEGDYLGFAELLRSGGYAGETQAVIQAGLASTPPAFTRQRQGVPELISWSTENVARDRTGLVGEVRDARADARAVTSLRVGDALYGYGRYAEAADLYRAALTKTGANRDIINLHLGAALAQANQRAEAEAALRAVTGQPAGLAALWLAWLGRSQG